MYALIDEAILNICWVLASTYVHCFKNCKGFWFMSKFKLNKAHPGQNRQNVCLLDSEYSMYGSDPHQGAIRSRNLSMLRLMEHCYR